MNFNINTKSAVAALIAMLMLLTAITGGALAAPAVTTDSDLTPTETTYIDPASDDVEELEFTVNNTNTSAVRVIVSNNETGTQISQVSDTDAALTETSTDTWQANISHSDLYNESEMDLGNETELDITIEHDHDDNGDGTTTTATTTEYHNVVPTRTTDEQTVYFDGTVADSDVGLDVDVESAADGFFGIGAEDFDTYSATNNHPHGNYGYNNTTYVLSGDVASAFDDSASDVEDGEVVLGMTVLENGEVVPTYANEAGDLHESNESYAVYNTTSSEVTTEFGEDRDDAFATDVTVTNEKPDLGFLEAREVFDTSTAIDLALPDLPEVGDE